MIAYPSKKFRMASWKLRSSLCDAPKINLREPLWIGIISTSSKLVASCHASPYLPLLRKVKAGSRGSWCSNVLGYTPEVKTISMKFGKNRYGQSGIKPSASTFFALAFSCFCRVSTQMSPRANNLGRPGKQGAIKKAWLGNLLLTIDVSS